MTIKNRIIRTALLYACFLFFLFQVTAGSAEAGTPSCSLTFNPQSGSPGFLAAFSWTSSDDADGQIPYSCSDNIGSGYLTTPSGSGTASVDRAQTCTLTVVNSDGLLRTCQASVGIVVNNGDDRVIISIQPQSARIGQSIQITGNNLHQNIYMTSSSGELNSLVGAVNADRSVVTFVIPSTLSRGSYSIKLGPNSIDVSNELPLTISSGVAPVITSVSPESAGPGQSVKIYGTNLAPQVQLQKTGGTNTDVTGTINDSQTEVQIEIPLDITSGNYKIAVLSPDGNAVSSSVLKITSGGSSFVPPRVIGAPTEGLPTDLGQLIEQIFGWSLMLLGIVVFVMFFYAGFLYLTAAGNTSNVGEAKTRMTNAVLGAILLLSSYLILNTINPDFVKNTFNLPGLGESQNNPNGGGGNWHCSDTGTSGEDYGDDVAGAINAVINSNPEGIADELNTAENSIRFLDFVAEELRSSGYNATTDVLNGHDIANSGDLIAVWRSGDATVERYDAIASVGAGDRPLSEAARSPAAWVGDIPPDCAGAD